MTEQLTLTHDELILRGAKWLRSSHGDRVKGTYHGSCGVVLTEFVSYHPAIPDVIGFNSYQSVVLECKVSRSDFLSDRNKEHRGGIKQLGNIRYYLTLPWVASSEDVIEGWGLLYAQSSFIQVVKVPVVHHEPEIRAAEYQILYSIARRVEIRGLMPVIREPQGVLL